MIEEFTLTEREIEVLNYTKSGKNNRAIADLMCISLYTEKVHMCSIFKKLNVHDRTEAVVKAIRLGIIDLY